MLPLNKTLRNKLERSIKAAREIAEDAAGSALKQLGIEAAKPFEYLTPAERILRKKLRAHGRQLGDIRDGRKQTQEINCLIEEVAYEHWHRMLFARFLAENNLLMYPDPVDPIAVTIEECEDLAADEGAKNGWELASQYAAKMLPQIFRPDSPSFALTFPPEHQQKLENLLAKLEPEIFKASDSLGWVYQFWQAKRKDEVNASETKIGARELPAVTQLFTEPYMVSFLLDNSLGAWWAGKRLSDNDFKTAKSEKELRDKASFDSVPLEYLRFVQNEDGSWTPAAGIFDGWPESLKKLKTLDPCCGSGHFLVAAFLMLVPMRMELEGLSARQAVDAVLNDNLNGLEIDQRCVELAAFALALTAWRYPGAGGYRILPELNVACSGLSISAKKDNWVSLAGDNPDLKMALGELYDQFKDAPVLGSLINPETSLKKESLFEIKWEDVSRLLKQALSEEKDDTLTEMGVVAQGISKTAGIIAVKYNWVITNVPYLKRGNQNTLLKEFSTKYYPKSQKDLATIFLEKCLAFCESGSTTCVVLPQNWLFLTTYKKLRHMLLKKYTWNAITTLGSGAFETISGEVVKAILLIISNNIYCGNAELDRYKFSSDNNSKILGIDVSNEPNPYTKSESLKKKNIEILSQKKQLKNPDARFSIIADNYNELIEKNAIAAAGFSTFDRPRFIINSWEISTLINSWEFSQSSVDTIKAFGGCSFAFLWENGVGQLCQFMEDKKKYKRYTSGIWRAGSQFWNNHGILVSLMGNLPASIYSGAPFDQNTALLVPNTPEMLPALWAYCSSNEFGKTVRQVDQSIKVTTATLEKVPVNWTHWTKIANEKYPNGLPKPYSNDPTQWIFHGHPCGSVIWDEEKKWTSNAPSRTDETVLQVAVARLLGYRWPAELDPEMELSKEAREWVTRCDELQKHMDEDGIVCIPAVRGELKADDRLENLLSIAFKDEWSNSRKAQLLASADHAGKTMETWLRDKFFIQHCRLFKHRPFIWQIWDGLNDGFSALVNYHKLDAKLLETLIYLYLGDWISFQKHNIDNGVDGAREKLMAAEQLKKKLELILEGEAPYDIFVRWKTIEKQSMGWNPDLNDGVRLNIRPFMTVSDVKKKDAGVLRDKPNIKWNKDRGKDVVSAPWYKLGLKYNGKEGDRINEHHLTLAEKKAAGDRKIKDGDNK